MTTRLFHEINLLALKRTIGHKAFGALFVHDDDIKRAVVDRLRGARLQDKILAIPDPVETQTVDIGRDEARMRLGLPIGLPLFLVFGGMRWDKGPDLALAALEDVETECGLVLAGSAGSVSESDVRELEHRLPWVRARLFPRLGWIREEEARLYFVAADCVVLPYRETYSGTSGVMQRAAAAGRPVIASNVRVLGKTVTENRMGLTVPPGSSTDLALAMNAFLRLSPAERNELGRAARRYARRCDWRLMAKRVRNAYVRALSE